jgi:hypothetical protein
MDARELWRGFLPALQRSEATMITRIIRWLSVSVSLLLGAVMIGCDGKQPDRGASLVTRTETRVWDTPHGPGQEIVTDHYRIFTNATSARLVRTLPGFMEAAYDHYQKLTGLIGRAEGLNMYMLASRADWVSLTRGRMGPAAEPLLSLEAGGYTIGGVTVCWDIGGLATWSVAAHEGMHQFLHMHLRNRLPAWADEGLATNSEGFVLQGDTVRFDATRNVARITDLRQAIIGDQWRPLEELLGTRSARAIAGQRKSALGYYGQLWALVHFLGGHEIHAAALRRLLADAQAGRFAQVVPASHLRLGGEAYDRVVGVTLFRHYITTDLEAFEREYRAHARALAKL